MAISKYVPTAVPTDAPSGTRSWLNDETRRISTMLRQLDEVYASIEDLADVAFSGDYNDLDNLPTLVTDHGALTGLSDDDHPQYGALAQNETVTGEWTFETPLRLTDSADTHFEINNTGATGNAYTQFMLNSATKLFIGVAGTSAAVIGDVVANDTFFRIPTGSMRFSADGGGESTFLIKDGLVQLPYDNYKLQLGASQDLQLYHDGTDSLITNATGKLRMPQDLWLSGAAQRSLYFEDTSATSGERVWRWIASGGDLYLQARTDADAGACTPLEFVRNGSALTKILITANAGVLRLGDLGNSSTREFHIVGSADQSYFMYGSNEDIYLRGGQSDSHIWVGDNSTGTVSIGASSGQIKFFGGTGSTKPTVSGSRGGNAALASLCTALATLGLITNSTS